MNNWWDNSQYYIFFFYTLYSYTITYLHTKFQTQRTSYDKAWIIDEMTINIIFFSFIPYTYIPLPIFIPNFKPNGPVMRKHDNWWDDNQYYIFFFYIWYLPPVFIPNFNHLHSFEWFYWFFEIMTLKIGVTCPPVTSQWGVTKL